MAISGVGQSYYQNNVATTKNVNNTERFALEKTESLRKSFMLNLRGYQRIEQSLIWRSIYRRRLLKI